MAKRYVCFTREQQEFYDKLPEKQKRYVDFRGQGYSKTKSYQMAGYDGKRATQASYMLETRNKGIAELIGILTATRKANGILADDSQINQQINALAEQQRAEDIISAVEGADGETARQIQFYRDILNGTIKNVKKTCRYDANGKLLGTKIEETSDIDAKIRARKELDRLLGLNAVIDLDRFQMGDITINIVDASKREELEDDRNKIVMDLDKIEIVDEKNEEVGENNKQEDNTE